VRQLLSHTSGIPDLSTADLIDTLDADPTRSWTAGTLAYVTDPLSPPGPPVMSYSNSNYLLLGLLIERMTGLSYPRRGAPRPAARSGRADRHAGPGDTDAPVAAPNLTGTTTAPDGLFLPNLAHASVAGAAGGIAADAAMRGPLGIPALRRPGPRRCGHRGPEHPGRPRLPGLGTEILEQRWAPTGGVIGHHGRKARGAPGARVSRRPAGPRCWWLGCRATPLYDAVATMDR